jgi:murein L,D-transpeptidase YafK
MKGKSASRLRAAVVGAAVFLSAFCAVRTPPPRSLPEPAAPAARPGPWDTTYALYDPALFGPELPLKEIIAAEGLRLENGKIRGARLLLNKAQRRLELWAGRRMIKAYRVQLGRNPVGPKRQRGDSRTPEGEYFICAHTPSTYYLALWISYPNLEDAKAGLAAKRLSQKQSDEIAAALAKGRCPPQNTRLGGDLLLHGQLPEHTAELSQGHRTKPKSLRPGLRAGDADPPTVREFYDWTDGCAGMFNPDIRELYEFVADGTPLTIIANGPITPPAR